MSDVSFRNWLDLESTVSLSQKLFCEVMGIVMGHEIIFRPPENKVKSRTNLLKAKKLWYFVLQ